MDHTDKQVDFATYGLNQQRGRLSSNPSIIPHQTILNCFLESVTQRGHCGKAAFKVRAKSTFTGVL